MAAYRFAKIVHCFLKVLAEGLMKWFMNNRDRYGIKHQSEAVRNIITTLWFLVLVVCDSQPDPVDTGCY